MNRRTRIAASLAPARAARWTVAVRRGYCGTLKSSGIGQAAHLDWLRAAVGVDGKVRIGGCLSGAREHANVIVVQPWAAGRAAGGPI